MAPVVFLAAGAAAMYFFDPEKGEARRTQLRGRFTSFRDDHPDLIEMADDKTVHLRNRAKGLLHETRTKIENKIDPPADAQSHMGSDAPKDDAERAA